MRRPSATAGLPFQLLGVALFLFIPVVLYLFVRHPAPVGWSLAAGVVLMLGHRFLARPYLRRAADAKCIWCNRAGDPERFPERVEVEAPGGGVRFSACAGHGEPARRFFLWADRLRIPLRLGIGVPLVLLLAALAAIALGRAAPVREATELFRLAVGVTVNLGALGPFVAGAARTPRAAFPLHNFSLLGVAAILWIFRLVGIWWIVAAGAWWLERLAG
ncbi:MAG: hypothetical protein KDB94_11620 [Acidobacteria bacterium]|nr:hypothetical protein [Acidobacteriota bacterium]